MKKISQTNKQIVGIIENNELTVFLTRWPQKKFTQIPGDFQLIFQENLLHANE